MESVHPLLLWLPYVGGLRRSETKMLVPKATTCAKCGKDASFVKYDNVLEIFSLPLWRWPGQNPAIVCNTCKDWVWTSHFEPFPTLINGAHQQAVPEARATPSRCWSCASYLEPIYRFCPECGSRQDFW